MKLANLLKGAQLLGLVAAGAMFTGCQTTEPVREVIMTEPGYSTEIVEPVAEIAASGCIDPVGESLIIKSPGDRYFNPLTRSWERPYPYGPYDTANWR